MAQNYCIDCLKKGIKTEISRGAKRCRSCGNKHSHKNPKRKKHNFKGKNNPFYGKHHKNPLKSASYGMKGKHHIIIAKKRISKANKKRWQDKNYRKKAILAHQGKPKHTERTKKILSEKQKGEHNSPKTEFKKGQKAWNKDIKKSTGRFVKHHIYLKENSDKKMKLNRGKHAQIHHQAYEYIYEVFGKKGIDNYIKWFYKKYGLKNGKK